MNLESLRGFDLDLPAILKLFPPEQVIENIGLEKFSRFTLVAFCTFVLYEPTFNRIAHHAEYGA